MSVKIIVDSASDIKIDFTNANDIAFVPLKTNLGGVEYRDGIDIVPDVFFEKLEQRTKWKLSLKILNILLFKWVFLCLN